MAGRGGTKPRRVPPGWKATGALSTRRWMVAGAEPVSLCAAREGRADPAGAVVNSCHPSHAPPACVVGRAGANSLIKTCFATRPDWGGGTDLH